MVWVPGIAIDASVGRFMSCSCVTFAGKTADGNALRLKLRSN
jgi:hypothetical protein